MTQTRQDALTQMTILLVKARTATPTVQQIEDAAFQCQALIDASLPDRLNAVREVTRRLIKE